MLSFNFRRWLSRASGKVFGSPIRKACRGRDLRKSAKPLLELLEVRLVPGQMGPNPLIVTTTSDNNSIGSLRYAINYADSNGGGTITFANGLSGTITLGSTDLPPITITSSVTITGPGAGVLTISASSGSRVFDIQGSGLNVSLSGLTITGGSIQTGITNDDGGGIWFTDSPGTLNPGTLNLSNMTILRERRHQRRRHSERRRDGESDVLDHLGQLGGGRGGRRRYLE